jgi:hypothetical protein
VRRKNDNIKFDPGVEHAFLNATPSEKPQPRSPQKKPLFPLLLRAVERREGKRFSNYTGYSSFLYKYSSALKKRAEALF